MPASLSRLWGGEEDLGFLFWAFEEQTNTKRLISAFYQLARNGIGNLGISDWDWSSVSQSTIQGLDFKKQKNIQSS